MDFINQILEKTTHNDRPFRVTKNGIIFGQPLGRKTGQFYGRSIAYLENGEWKGKDITLRPNGAGFNGKGTYFHILPTGEVRYGPRFRKHSYGFGVYDISSSVYSEIEKLSVTGFLNENRLVKPGGSLYEWSIHELGSTSKTELVLYEKPANLSGDLFVIETELFGQGLSLPDGEMLENLEYDGLIVSSHGVVSDSDPLTSAIQVRTFVKNMGGPKIVLYQGVSVEWLDNATYPVTIDPTITPKTESTDGDIIASSAVSLAQARITSTSFDTSSTEVGASVAHFAGPDPFVISRAYLAFDTSVIIPTATILDATMSLKVSSIRNDGITTQQVHITDFRWATPISSGNRQANWDGALGGKIAEFQESDTMSVGNIYESSSFTDFSVIEKEGETRICQVHENDYLNTLPGGSGILSYVRGRSGDYGTAADRVFITVEYAEVLPAVMTLAIVDPGVRVIEPKNVVRVPSMKTRLQSE